LFDVDVKIDRKKVVRLVMTDQDDPFKVTKKFQVKYSLSVEATNALYKMLKANHVNEKLKLK
jgi:hypothetical protein